MVNFITKFSNMMKTTFDQKYLKIFLFLFLLSFLTIPKSYSQCAGTDNAITICTKETYNQGIGNPNGILNLYTLLGGTPTPGGTWADLNSSGGLNPITGLLNTWQINQGGVYNYRYLINGVPGCVDNISIITVTLGGFPGVDNLNAVACVDDTSVPLFSFLGSNPNPHFNGVWSGGPPGTVTGNSFNAQLAGVGTYLLTYTVPAVGTCPSRAAQVSLTVHPLPIAGTPTPLIFCETDDFSTFTNVDLYDQLTGEDSGGFWTDASGTGELSGPGDSFINIQNIATNFGPGTYNFTYTVNPSHPICNQSTASVAVTIKPVVDLNGSTLTVAPNICFSEIGITPIIGTITQGVTPIANGTYNITYVLTGANSGTATVPVTFTGGVATFTVNSAFLTTVGTTTVNITTVLDPSTAPTNCTRTISNLNGSFIINENPDISDSQLNILDFCIDQTGQGQISDINAPTIQLSNGTYTVTFNITGPNGTVTGQTSTITINAGSGVFAIANALTPIDGNYSLTITNIRNTATNCSTPANITDTFVVFPIPDALSISVSIPNICDGENVVVNITGATNLPNGLYNINYDITGAINAPGQTASNLLFTGGSATFTLPSGILVLGTSTLTLTNLSSASFTCDTTTFTNPSATFQINPIPNISDSQLNIVNICVGETAQGQLSDINGPVIQLIDGTYTITYNITGPSGTLTGQTSTVTIVGGSGAFPISSALTAVDGNYSVTVTNITNTVTTCTSTANLTDTFVVSPIPDATTIAVSIPPVCDGNSVIVNITGATNLTNGLYTINYDITGAITAPGQTATNVSFVGGSGSFVLPNGILVIGTSTLTITSLVNVAFTCQTTTFTNPTGTIQINPLPNVSDSQLSIADFCLGQSGVGIVSDITAPVIQLNNGTYEITFNVNGPSGLVTGQTATITVSGGNGSFTIPAGLTPIDGNYTLTITNIRDTATNCSSPANISDSFIVSPIPDAVSIAVSIPDICDGGNVVVNLSGATNLTNGLYTLNYNITGAITAPGQIASNVLFTGGNASFTLPVGILALGSSTLTITNLINSSSTCQTTTFSNPTDNFQINPLPNVTDSQLNIADICLGQTAQGLVTDITAPTIELTDGTYTVTYNITGPGGPVNGQISTMTIVGGSGSFPIPSALTPIAGNYSVNITLVQNNATTCSSAVNLSDTFIVNPIPDALSIVVSINDVCDGSPVTANISGAVNLTNGLYNITYDVTGAINAPGQIASNVSITAGSGSFVLPPGILTVGGSTLTITNLSSSSTTCQTTTFTNPSDTFQINPIPNILVSEVAIAPICIGNNATVAITTGGGLINGNYQVNYSISGANGPTTQTAAFTIPGGTFSIPSALLTNIGLTTVTFNSVTNTDTTCSNTLNFGVDFMVNPLPNVTPSQFNIADICLGQNASGAISNATNLVDSSYTILYDLTGTNTAVNQSSTLTIVSGAGSFVIPSSVLTNAGATIATITSITNNTTGCTTSPIAIADSFIINPLPDTTGTTVAVTEPICLGSGTTATINSPLLADGTYNISYDLSGANTISGTSTLVLASGNGTFIIQSSELINAGNYTITITGITDPTTVCTGTSAVITDTFVVNPIPVILPSEVTIADICVGSNASVAINSLGLIDGNYDLTYTLSGANVMAAQTVNLIVVGGVTNFTIPAAQLTNTGLTSMTINTVINTVTTCSNTFTNLQIDFNVNPIPTINAGEMTVADVCLGQDAVSTLLNAVNLADGTYSITYDLTGVNIAAAQTATVTITGGAGIFYIPTAILSNTGGTTITITSVTNTVTGCFTSGLLVSDTFTVVPLPNVTGATITSPNICINTDAEVFITNASSLTDGTYTIIYDLSGANAGTNNSVVIQIISGTSSNFIIPTSQIPNAGATTVTIQDLIYDLTLCGANTLTLNPITFTITDPGAPTLNTDGNLFCIQDNPTISDLTANVTPGATITWYNSASGGTAYNATDALANNTTYYATLTDGNGCVSSTRLEVTVDLTACGELFIPDGFSPNGDSVNEEFYIKDIELLYPEFVLEIYNRYGNMVYKGNINTPRFNGKPNQTTLIGKEILPTGVYFYIIHFNDAIGTEPKQGRLYLSR